MIDCADISELLSFTLYFAWKTTSLAIIASSSLSYYDCKVFDLSKI